MNNELIIEGLYEDFMEEALDTGTLPMYSESEIREIVMERFYAIT